MLHNFITMLAALLPSLFPSFLELICPGVLLKFRVETLQLRCECLPDPFHVTLPLMVVTGCLRAGESLAQLAADLENAHRGFLRFLELLLDGVVLGLEREDPRVALREGIQLSLGLIRGKRDQFRGHQVADRADVLLVVDAGENTVEELAYVREGEGRVQGGIERLIGTLLLPR